MYIFFQEAKTECQTISGTQNSEMDLEDEVEEPSSKISKKTDSPMEEKISVELKSKDDQIKMLQNTLQVNGYELSFSLLSFIFQGNAETIIRSSKEEWDASKVP